ncbi:hypothetical protein L208DRAFT_1420300 [Tricholoma matsutake]|nr:hypothetical protein L208DRAFT_1420300 [Tricholoma matsutake 945]
MANALNTFYRQHGFILLNRKQQSIQDAFLHRDLGYAIQWYDILGSLSLSELSFPATSPIFQPPPLMESCFGGTRYGQSFDEGGDVHVAVDGNFNHCHLRSGGECPEFYASQFILPKDQIDAVGDCIDSIWKRLPKAWLEGSWSYQHSRRPKCLIVPDEAVDECESSHMASSGSKSKTNMEKFDNGGQMALVCHHNIPLFLANINTPGEQQKYSVTLFEHLFSLMPSHATLVGLYDVGCVLDCSLQLHDILPSNITEHFLLVTSAMHAYTHQWSCQLVYNPQLQKGLGLSDGEGVEQLWSKMQKLIGIMRRLKKGVEGQGGKAQAILEEVGISVEELQVQWELQQVSQLSLCAYALAHLKKELDIVLNLQADLDTVDSAIQSTHALISKSDHPVDSLNLLASLQETHENLKKKVEALYASLNVHETFPELQGLDFEFWVIGSFFEWDKLDQAAGGCEQALGTKLHQTMQKAISKHTPALMNVICNFNKYCMTLETLYKPEWDIPLPELLLTQLTVLWDSSTLMEDIWITPMDGQVPRWLEDVNVCEGIHAVLKMDWCLEEYCCLGLEANNLCRWFGHKLSAVEVALATPSNQSFLKLRWATMLVLSLHFDVHISSAKSVVSWLHSHAAIGAKSGDYSMPSISEELEIYDVDNAMPDNEPRDMLCNDVLLDLMMDEMVLNDILVNEDEADHADEDTDVCTSEQVVVLLTWSVLPHIMFESKDLHIMQTSSAPLNDTCLNGIAALFHAEFSQASSPSIRLHQLEYWNKDFWILPVHRTHPSLHWVLCCISLHTRQLFLFDSLSDQLGWRHDTKDIMCLITKLVILTNKQGYYLPVVTEGWSAHPLVVYTIQTNRVDCGLWVLAAIAAVLRGYQVMALHEEDMVGFRELLYNYISLLHATTYM